MLQFLRFYLEILFFPWLNIDDSLNDIDFLSFALGLQGEFRGQETVVLGHGGFGTVHHVVYQFFSVRKRILAAIEVGRLFVVGHI